MSKDGGEDIVEHGIRWGAASPLLRLVATAAILTLLLALGRARLPIRDVTFQASGTFVENGSVPGGAPPPTEVTRIWSSWAGSDDHRGEISIGPFPAPGRLGFFGRGYPRIGGNRLYLENTVTGEIFDPDWQDFSESWVPTSVSVPASWVGQPILIRAVDDAAEWGGWLALSTPFRVPGPVAWWNGPPARFCAFLLVGVHLCILLLGARLLTSRFVATDDESALMVAWGVLALGGYLVFWLTFCHDGLGSLAAWLILGGAAVVLWRTGPRDTDRHLRWRNRDWMIPCGLTVGAGVLYLATLHEFAADSSISHLAQHRFSSGAPTDNVIPQIFAGRLLRGESPRQLMGDWLSSDRPPLQTGWVLLLSPVARFAGVDFDTAAQCAGIWFQMAWLPAVWWFLRRLGAGPAAAAGIVVALVPCGSLMRSSVYVWPKLGAGAFMLAAYTCWFLVAKEQGTRRERFAAGGGFAGLAWLGHGGVAFSMLALVPLAVLRGHCAGWRACLWAAAAFLVLAVPWFAYQKLYEPPGNRLAKWHIAGSVPVDDRSFAEALVDSYRTLSWEKWAAGRRANVRTLFSGHWEAWASFDFSDTRAWREAHAHAFFSLGWWNLGFVALPLLALPAWRDRRTRIRYREIVRACGWSLLALVVWVLLMFIPGSTLGHQGSYTTNLVLFCVLAFALWRVHPLACLTVAVAQLIVFIRVWAVRPDHWAEVPASPAGVAAMALSYLLLLAIAIRAARDEQFAHEASVD